MGTWSHEPFGNDAANDWAYGLEDGDGMALVEEALDKVLEAGDDYVDAGDAEEAVAAIEVLAKLLGKGTQSDSYTKRVDAWVAAHPGAPSPALRQKARGVLARIAGADSELAELWDEGDDAAAWRASLAALQRALG